VSASVRRLIAAVAVFATLVAAAYDPDPGPIIGVGSTLIVLGERGSIAELRTLVAAP
jgi:hypothetical protein